MPKTLMFFRLIAKRPIGEINSFNSSISISALSNLIWPCRRFSLSRRSAMTASSGQRLEAVFAALATAPGNPLACFLGPPAVEF